MRKFLVALLFNLLLCINVFASTELPQMRDSFTITHTENSSEQKYVQSLANSLNISYEEAYEINKLENQKYLSKLAMVIPAQGIENQEYLTAPIMRRPIEVARYKTVYGSTRISNTPNVVEMAVEVKYVYSNLEETALEILSVGEPYMYIPGASSYDISGGGYNKEVTKTSSRISRTASLVYTVSSSTGISVGGDVLSVDKSFSSDTKITVRAKTYVLNIDLGDL